MAQIDTLTNVGAVVSTDLALILRGGANVLGTFGSLVGQNATSVTITGGTVNNTVIGGVTPAAGSFTTGSFSSTLGVTGAATFSGTVTANGLDLGATTDAATVSTTPSDYQLQLGAANSTTGDIGQNISFETGGNVTASINSYDAGSSAATGLAFFTGTSSTLRRYLDITAGGDVSLYESTGTTAKLVWDASAESLGIGTSSPATTLHITKDGNQSAVLDAYEAQQVSHNTIAYTRWVQNASGIANIMGVDSSAGILGTSSNHALAIRTNSTERMRIDASGNLLVGKTATAFGTAGIEARAGGTLWATASGTNAASFNRLSTDGPIVYFNRDGAGVGSIGAQGGAPYISGPLAGGVKFSYLTSTNATIFPVTTTGAAADGLHDLGYAGSRFRNLYLSNNLLVGETSSNPYNGLTTAHVFKGASSTGGAAPFGIYNSTGSASCPVLNLLNRDTSTDATQRFIQFYGNVTSTTNTPMGGIVGNGASNVQFASISDIREKENITTISGSLSKINSLNPVEFDWIASGEHCKAGFVAQEVEQIFPEFVVENMSSEGQEERKGLTGGMTGGIVAHLVKAMQEQQAIIEALTARIEALEGA